MVIILQHIHADVNSSCCTPETNIRLYVSYTSIKKKIAGEDVVGDIHRMRQESHPSGGK